MHRFVLATLVAATLACPAAPSWAAPEDCPPGVAEVTGTNPSYAEIASLLYDASVAHDVPLQLLKAIAYQESNWRQYTSDGPVLISQADNDCGVGIMQVTAIGRDDAVELAQSIEHNIDVGAGILAQKYDENQADNPVSIGPDDRYLIENWYYATCAYNGCTGSSTTYTDEVAARVVDPFRWMSPVYPWSPPLGYTRPQTAYPSYAFPGGFQAQRGDHWVFYDWPSGTVTHEADAPTHDWLAPPPIVYPAASLGPDAPGVTCAGCEYWRLAAGYGAAGRAHWTNWSANPFTTATWKPALPRSGRYRVSAYVPVVPDAALIEAPAGPPGVATYDVAGTGVAVDQATQTGWVGLGDHTLAPGNTVTLTDQTASGHRLYADAVRFAIVPKVDIAVSAGTVTYGQAVTVTARLSHLGNGASLAGRQLRIYRRKAGTSAWSLLGTGTSGSDGRVRIATKPVQHTEYTARFWAASDMVGASSGTKRVNVRTLVRAVLNGTTSVSASVAPNHAGHSAYLQRYYSGAWHTLAVRTLSSSSTTVFPIRFGRGTYYLRVYKPADSDHAAGLSSTLTLRVT